MKTIGEFARESGAEVKESWKNHVIKKVSKRIAAEDCTFYYSGRVVQHLSVVCERGGLNNTGLWPYFLVDDEGKMKIVQSGI